MNANRANPFNSPPSSTGSHGTVTMSSLFSEPEGESTRRLNEDIARVTAPKKLPVNWDAAHRKWPEYFSKPKTNNQPPVSDDTTDTRPWHTRCKENKPPAVSAVKFTLEDSTQDIWPGTRKTRAVMQARVDDESDMPSILDTTPARPTSHYGAPKSQQNQSPMSKVHTRAPSEPVSKQRSSSVTDALNRLQRASLSPRDLNQESPHMSSAKSSLTAVPPSPASIASPGHNTSNVRSFFMPDISHLGDFVTGTLKFSGSMKNGVPIFVKHGRVHDRQEKPIAGAHAQVDGIKVPHDEEKIFVSMDMIREEIVSLQAAHDKVQEYAEGLQLQVERLEAQLRHGKVPGGYNESGKFTAERNRLELEVATLQARLDEASRKLSTNTIESESVAHERDRAISRLQDACDDISKLTRKLSVREKELSTSQKQLESSEQMRQGNDALRRDLVSLKHSRDALELDNVSLRKDNETLRKEQKRLRDEVDSLRSARGGQDDDMLQAKIMSLQSSNDRLTEENEDLRENLDGAHHELDAAREEMDSLRSKVDSVIQEKSALQEDNESLVRHNDKYFNENKLLRRENSGFERSVRDLHEENLKMKEEVDFLKQQLDHCRPPHNDDASGRIEEKTEENMTSAYFVPDITVRTNDSRPGGGDTETKDMPTLPEVTSHGYTLEQGAREVPRLASHSRQQRSESRPRTASKGVAFSIPEKSAPRNKSSSNMANQGSKRRQADEPHGEVPSAALDLDLTNEMDDTGGLQSEDYTNQDAAISLNLSMKDARFVPHNRDLTSQSNASRRGSSNTRPAQKHIVQVEDATKEPDRSNSHDSCPALSTEARRVLDGLCKHSCRNCIVCSRITSHGGVVSSAEAASGKKRVNVPRPVPVTDRNMTGEDLTMRPSQPPGHALALVIKGLEDEAEHLQLHLTRLQSEYNRSDKATGRRDRLRLAESIRVNLKRMEVKNDQIYSLYDVLEGQKAAGQAMTEEEVEMTVLNITGMTVRDVTQMSEQLTWEGIQETA
ncbi:uncharacterized protein UV8b_01611 [Ustilaginoidea virens]|uniref:Rhoptry protein n=2 Tax=Ustilaginoidea virens TaxID=1159556 RepID=A0A8E5HLC4_USTVR|nr:uncharacterized protein UV8b_01611 [Ustilaginoidea virens]QUC17370.1 hypothetical protein UV8b_01611 [Ustilaginoidea virens]